jgi:serine/threonine-protein kinase
LRPLLGRQVVVKVLPPELAAGVNTERFRREIQLSAQLHHPYIVPVLAAGEIGEMLYYTMPYIEGESLNNTVNKSGRLSAKDVIRVLHDVVDALAYAHSRGVIHRDIKPANILSLGNHSLVTDFGVAKAISASMPATGITSGGFAIGTPAYMAPEQLAADPLADHRVDIYAVGLLAYELLLGSSPFAGTSPQATMAAQLTRVPEPLHKIRPDVPDSLSRLIQRCMEKLPENRPASAQELLLELSNISNAQGDFASGRPTLRSALAQPRQHIRYLATTFTAILLVVTGAYGSTTFIVNKSRELRGLQAAQVDNGQSPTPASKGGTALDKQALTSLSPGAATAPLATDSAQYYDLTALADSLRMQLSDARRRDSAFITDSVRDVIEREVLDSLTRLARLGRGAGPGRGGAPPPRGSVASLRGPLGRGEKRVLVLDFQLRVGQLDSSRLGAILADSLRALLAQDGAYTAVGSALAREIAASQDPRVMADAIRAGAIISGVVTPTRGGRGGASLVVRLNFSEPARAIQPTLIASIVTTRDNAGTVADSLLVATRKALEGVTWPVGREGGRGGPGGPGDGGRRGGFAPPPVRDTLIPPYPQPARKDDGTAQPNAPIQNPPYPFGAPTMSSSMRSFSAWLLLQKNKAGA